MPSFCAVSGCNNKASRNPDVVYHNFPRNPERLKHWVKFCGRKEGWIPQKNQGICSSHFTDDSYDNGYKLRPILIGAKVRRTLRTNALPGEANSSDLVEEKAQEVHFVDINEMAKEISYDANSKAFEVTDYAAIDQTSRAEKRPRVERTPQMVSPESELESVRRTMEIQAQQIMDLKEANVSLQLQLEKENPDEKLTKELALAKLEIQEQQQYITDLKVANSKLASQCTSEGKALRKRVYDMEKQVRVCEEEHMDRMQFIKQMKLSLKEVLSENQMDVILGRKQFVHWTTEEISKALAIYSMSKSCYVYLRDELNFPLPGISTLQYYARQKDSLDPVVNKKSTGNQENDISSDQHSTSSE
ncbi:THAP domain-containing protein 1-like [Sabethes cyaneus]|uniref:THAP domain-containing protein 1-like n=1 Tax=Sabethes cyaneus TaxID=53552 RepID=UPI00237E0720|nr:THAP domain-containing protein 1-like [Sabethes cyaneus]